MNNLSKKAIILESITSPYIYQAIIILNESGINHQSKALADAEKIVLEYIKSNSLSLGENSTKIYSKPKKDNKKKYRLLVTLLSVSTFISLLFIGFVFFSR